MTIYNKEFIEDMEVVEIRKKVINETEGKTTSPYGTEEEMKARASEGYYVRDPESDLVHCPGGETLRRKSIKKNGATRYANKHVCSKCPFCEKCVTGKTKWRDGFWQGHVGEKSKVVES